MPFGHSVVVASIATDSKITGAISIYGCAKIGVELQTCANFLSTATCNVYISVCDTSTGTFRRLRANGVYSGASGIYDIEVPSTIGNSMIVINEAAGYKFAKIEFNNTCSVAANIRVHVMQ